MTDFTPFAATSRPIVRSERAGSVSPPRLPAPLIHQECHMPRVKAVLISADRLKSFVERIEKLSEERDAIGSDIREVYAEAKGVGYDVKTMRKVMAERKIDPADRDEQEALLDVYRHALGSNSYRAVAEQFGISKSKLHRLVPKNETGTGEIETASSGSAGEGRETAVEGSPAPALASIQASA